MLLSCFVFILYILVRLVVVFVFLYHSNKEERVVLKAGMERGARQVNKSFLQIVHCFLPLHSD